MYRRKRISSARCSWPNSLPSLPSPLPPFAAQTNTSAFDAKNDINAAAQTTNQTNSRQIDTHTQVHTHRRTHTRLQNATKFLTIFQNQKERREIKIKLQNARQIFLSSRDHHSAGQLLMYRTCDQLPPPSFSLLLYANCSLLSWFACFPFSILNQQLLWVWLHKVLFYNFKQISKIRFAQMKQASKTQLPLLHQGN